MPGLDLRLPDGLPPWLAAFVLEAQRETDTLRENGAEQAAAARLALLRKLVAAAAACSAPLSRSVSVSRCASRTKAASQGGKSRRRRAGSSRLK